MHVSHGYSLSCLQKFKKKMEETRDQLTEALYQKGLALSETESSEVKNGAHLHVFLLLDRINHIICSGCFRPRSQIYQINHFFFLFIINCQMIAWHVQQFEQDPSWNDVLPARGLWPVHVTGSLGRVSLYISLQVWLTIFSSTFAEQKGSPGSAEEVGKGASELEAKDLFEENFKELKKWADVKSSKYGLLSVIRERQSGRLGTALKVGDFLPKLTFSHLW